MRCSSAIAVVLIACAPLGARPLAAQPKAGDMAPDFTLRGSDGKVYHLAEYRGKQSVVLAWFAKAFTSG